MERAISRIKVATGRHPDAPTGRVPPDQVERLFNLLIEGKDTPVRERDPETGVLRSRLRVIQPVGRDPLEWAGQVVYRFLGEERLKSLTLDQVWAEIDLRAKGLRPMAWLNTKEEQAFLVAARLIVTHIGTRRALEGTIS